VARGARRTTTNATYLSAWPQWVDHCRRRGVPALAFVTPGSALMGEREAFFQDYLATRWRGGLGWNGLRGIRSAVRAAHSNHGYPSPTDGPLVSLIVRTAKLEGPPVQQDDPATPQLLRVLMSSARLPRRLGADRPGGLDHLRDIVLLLVHFGMRSFDSLASDDGGLNAGGLRYRDVRLYDLDGKAEVDPCGLRRADAVLISLRKSKTQEQAEQRLVLAAVPGSRNAALCPVAAARRIQCRAKAWRRREGELLCQVGPRGGGRSGRAGQWRPLRRAEAADLIKDAAKRAGVATPGSKWASHSAKGGGTTWLRAARYDDDYVGMMFRWSDPSRKMVRYYGRASLEMWAELRDEYAAQHRRFWDMDVTVPRRFDTAADPRPGTR